jgi:hypothetical protein
LVPRTERTKTASSATATQITTAFLGVLLGPDRDLLQVAQFVQGVRIEVRHGLGLP